MSRGYAPYESCTKCAGKAQPGAVNLLKYVMNRFDYTSSLGIYNCRYIAGTTTLSNHSCGCAVDIFIPHNGWGKPRPALGNPVVQFLDAISKEIGLTEQIYNRVRYSAAAPNGKAYGGVHPHHDHVHLSITKAKGLSLTYQQIEAAAVAAGYSPNPGPSPSPTPNPGDDEVTLKKGDKGNAVRKFQQAILNENKAALPKFGADGDYGNETVAAVKDYQRRADLAQTGEIDGVTGSLLLEYMADRVGGGGTEDQTARTAAAKAQASATSAQSLANSNKARLDKYNLK